MAILDLTLSNVRGFALWATQGSKELPPEMGATVRDVMYPRCAADPSHELTVTCYDDIVLDGRPWSPYHQVCAGPCAVIVATFVGEGYQLLLQRDGEGNDAPLHFILLRAEGGAPVAQIEFNTYLTYMYGYGRCNGAPFSVHTDGIDQALALLNATLPRELLQFIRNHAGASDN